MKDFDSVRGAIGLLLVEDRCGRVEFLMVLGERQIIIKPFIFSSAILLERQAKREQQPAVVTSVHDAVAVNKCMLIVRGK